LESADVAAAGFFFAVTPANCFGGAGCARVSAGPCPLDVPEAFLEFYQASAEATDARFLATWGLGFSAAIGVSFSEVNSHAGDFLRPVEQKKKRADVSQVGALFWGGC
jgi:hypothetical protein